MDGFVCNGLVVMRDGDCVEVEDDEEIVVRVLVLRPLVDGVEIIYQVGRASGLHAREDELPADRFRGGGAGCAEELPTVFPSVLPYFTL